MQRRLPLVAAAVFVVIVVVALVVGLRNRNGETTGAAASEVPRNDGAGPTVVTGSGLVAAFRPFDAPLFEGPAIDGSGPVSLAALQGRPVVINFWASWCVPCRKEAPELVAFARSHPGVTLVGVDVNEPRSDGLRFARKAGWTWHSVSDNGALMDAYRVSGVPQTFFVDASGRVVERIPGQATQAALLQKARAIGA